ncbi:hypothetical protein BKA70DRAFT_1220460 [Coprinopsis sp. MPI-PUGE-AT-0042]|nr:hypothetical protein BKA70DRAFT_1231793 [Coprinopsis sp. MPI-PUGE-AT-0042]KAH6910550.1 hypothetical protein BKA70DRAFT_1220460 [Coprinopsis sp. MPI-PUGE-AT-0042]
MLKTGVSKDMLHDLLIECCLCQMVVLKCCFPHDHHCPRKLKFQHTELDVTRPIHRKTVGYLGSRMVHGEDDNHTDIETDSAIETDIEINLESEVEIDQMIGE